jgi:hypothetical protein
MNVTETLLTFTATLLGSGLTATASLFRNEEGIAVAWTVPTLGGRPAISFDQVDDLALDIANGNGWTLVQARDVQEDDTVLFPGCIGLVDVRRITGTYVQAISAETCRRVGFNMDLDQPVLVCAYRYR